MLLLGCSSVQQWLAQAGGRTADVQIALQAGSRVNVDSKGRPLSVVVRVFQLRQRDEFDRSSYETLTSEGTDKLALADDLIGTQEMLLLPNSAQRYQERLPLEVQYIGLVAAFRKPSPNGWRLALPVSDLVERDVVVNLGPCFLNLSPSDQPTYRNVASRCADIRRKPLAKTPAKTTRKNVQTP